MDNGGTGANDDPADAADSRLLVTLTGTLPLDRLEALAVLFARSLEAGDGEPKELA